MIRQTAAVAATSLRELSRRRVALAFVVLLPLSFYLLRLDVHWQAIRFLAIGVAWAVATFALFLHAGSRRLDARMCLVGASPTALFLGRQLALVGVGLAVAAAYVLLVVLTLDVPRPGALALMLATTVLLATPLGALVALVVPRELEGALALLSLMAVQLLMDPDDAAARLLPLWSTRELSAYAISPVGIDYLERALVHFALVLVVSLALAWAVSTARLRPVRLPLPAPDVSERA